MSQTRGWVEGLVSNDYMRVSNLIMTSQNFLLVENALGYNNSIIDGNIGMSSGTSGTATLFISSLQKEKLIDKQEFTMYLGLDGVDESYIEFGSYQGDRTNRTAIKVVQDPKEVQNHAWCGAYYGIYYNGTKVDLLTTVTRWETHYERLGFPNKDLNKIVEQYANGREVLKYKETDLFGFECKNRNDLEDLVIAFGDRNIAISPFELFVLEDGHCMLNVKDLKDATYIRLGTSFLRGVKTVYDVEGQQMIIIEQTKYEYDTDYEPITSSRWFWIFIGCAAALVLAIISFILCRRCAKGESQQEYQQNLVINE